MVACHWLRTGVLLAAAVEAPAACARSEEAAIEAGAVVVVDLNGPIGPASSAHASRALSDAGEADAEIVVFQLDTPGGLDTSMRSIVRETLQSSVPVIAYVAPRGARAASAGTFIVYAAHVAAMAPGTNIGAASPVTMAGGQPEEDASGRNVELEKATNDAVAFIRSLAELRGRNVEWAERAVREAASLSADAALKANVVDLEAADLDELLQRLNGLKVSLPAGDRQLQTQNRLIQFAEPSLTTQALALLTNPNVALLLMLLGVYGLLFELASPGAVFPGLLGAMCLFLGLYALHVLPISWAGAALLALGLALMTAEAFVPSFGILGVGGAIAFVVGGLMLVDADIPDLRISPRVLLGAAMAMLALLTLVLRRVAKAQKRKPVSGREALESSHGEVISWADGHGVVRVAGERWSAKAGIQLRPGQRVQVKAVHGLELSVEPANHQHRGARP